MDVHKHSAQIERLEVVETGRRRRWSDDEKFRIVLESLETPRAISSTARRRGPDHLPRERVIVRGPVAWACACARCGGARLSRLGEDVTETLEVIPKSWKVIQHVRERFSCRDCEKISQPPST